MYAKIKEVEAQEAKERQKEAGGEQDREAELADPHEQ